MSLPSEYLEYPKRRHGMDHDLYPWSNMFDRPPVKWPGDKPIALWITVALEFFPLTPNDGPFRAPGHMATPYPDLRTYTTKDYGNRVGVYRIMRVLDKLGLKATAPVNAAVARRYPPLIEAVNEAGWEIIGHGVDMNSLHYGGLAEDIERAYIAETLSTLREVSGQPVRGWLSPARSESENTPRLLAEAGVDYLCDWVNDDMPYDMSTPAGRITAMPHTYELEDRHVITVLGQLEELWSEQVLDAARRLRREAEKYGGRVLHLSLTPYVIGQPFRIAILEHLLEALVAEGGIWSATGGEIHSAWRDQVG
ncbi:MAG: polysaccharide deacetylase [Alphaproteobacteria bacterium]|nr:MAG: polysaccharide deacetylase [Alphaproteobacteria bacterium]